MIHTIGTSITLDISRMFPQDVREALIILYEEYVNINYMYAKEQLERILKIIIKLEKLVQEKPEYQEMLDNAIAERLRYQQQVTDWTPRRDGIKQAIVGFGGSVK